MKINFFLNDKIKDRDILKLFDDYKKRCGRFISINLHYELCEKIVSDENSYNIYVSPSGKCIDSINFSKLVNECALNRVKNLNILFKDHSLKNIDKICFINEKIDESFLYVMVMEQVYRAYKINNNETYHK